MSQVGINLVDLVSCEVRHTGAKGTSRESHLAEAEEILDKWVEQYHSGLSFNDVNKRILVNSVDQSLENIVYSILKELAEKHRNGTNGKNYEPETIIIDTLGDTEIE